MSKKILVADDSPIVRKVVESLLKKQGYEVLWADDGASALETIRINKPDLIFLDASLPILDGPHVCEELKRNDKLKDIPVIMLLTPGQVGKESQLKGMGADAFMVKPFNPKDILENVRNFVEKESAPLGEKMQIHHEREKSKDEFAKGEERLNLNKNGLIDTASKKSKKMDESLDILETSDVLESLEAPFLDTKEPHGFDWFISELKKETEELRTVDLGAKQKSKEKLNSADITSLAEEDLRKKAKDERKAKIYQIDEDQEGSEDFLNELRGKLEESALSVGSEAEKSLDHKTPSFDYDKIIQGLIESISTKIAQEVVKKLDPEMLRETVRDEIGKLKRGRTKAH